MAVQSAAHAAKSKQVKDLAEQIKNAKTLMIVSIKSLPSRQFQDIKKGVREHAKIQVAKKNIMIRAIKEVGKEKASIADLEKYIKENSAFAISDMEGYELAGILAKKKNPVFAKAGQIASEDIEVKEGPTDLVPGPAISELGSLGIQVAVEDGKISIKAPKVVVNKDGVINEATASLLQKLNIQPFKVGLEPQIIYDVENEKIYTDIKIDPESATEELKTAAGKALGFAQKIIYYCKETIGYFLAKANAEGESLNKLQPAAEEKKEESTVKPTQDKTSESEPSSTSIEDNKTEKEDADTVNNTQAESSQASGESPASTTDNKDGSEENTDNAQSEKAIPVSESSSTEDAKNEESKAEEATPVDEPEQASETSPADSGDTNKSDDQKTNTQLNNPEETA